jgi:hypothetical protein
MMEALAFIKSVVALFPSANKAMIAILILSGAALALPDSALQKAGVLNNVHAHHELEVGAFALAFTFLFLVATEALFKARRLGSRLEQRCREASQPERDIFELLKSNHSVIKWIHEPGIAGLLADGVIEERPSSLGADMRVFVLNRIAKKYALKAIRKPS